MAFRGKWRLLLMTLVVWLVLPGSPASAHEGHDHGSPEAIPNMLTRIQSIAPQVDGFELTVIERGEYLQLRNTSGQDITILGYEDEPYLKVTPEAVFENQSSTSVEVNGRSRSETESEGTTPTGATTNDEVNWVQIANEPVARWHDHRVHWMSPNPPRIAEGDPHNPHVIFTDWNLLFTVGDQPISARGDLIWEPSPDPIAGTVLALILTVGVIVFSWKVRRATILVALGGLLVSVVVHHIAARPPGVESTLDATLGILSASPTTWAAWAALVAAFVFVALGTRTQEAAILTLFGSVVIAFTSGLSDINLMVPYGLDRFAVPANLGLALGLMVVSLATLLHSSKRVGNVLGMSPKQ